MIDLDELDKMLDDIALHYSPAFAGELKKAIQELRLAREEIKKCAAIARTEFANTIIQQLSEVYNWEGATIEVGTVVDGIGKVLQAYNQHTEGKDTSGGLGETE